MQLSFHVAPRKWDGPWLYLYSHFGHGLQEDLIHYYKLKKEETEAHLHPMVEHEMKYLIPFVKDDSEGDVGQRRA